MANAKVSNGSIQVKCVLVALIGIVTTILFIASIVLITIGYLNPFGTVGLGILGGGCVVFFSAVLFLCASSIWIKNKYYGDQTDYKEKLVGRSNEDITLLKPDSHIVSSEHLETGARKNDIQGNDNNPVPLYSVSTVYSFVSSSSPTSPEKLMPYSWQEEDLAGTLDSDVFSSSLTALQHGDMRSQQRQEPTKSPTGPLIGGYNGQNGQKVKDEQKRPLENKADINIEKYVYGLPRQRKPMVMDSSDYTPHGNDGKQVKIPLTDVQTTKETHSRTNKDLWDRNTPHCSVDPSKTTAAAPQLNDCKGNRNHEKDRAQGERNKNNTKQIFQTADSQGSSITEMQNAKTKKQGIVRKDLITALAGDLEKKHNSKEVTDKCNQDRTATHFQGLSPQTKLDQSANIQISSHATRAEAPRGKVGITRNQIEPGTRTNQ